RRGMAQHRLVERQRRDRRDERDEVENAEDARPLLVPCHTPEPLSPAKVAGRFPCHQSGRKLLLAPGQRKGYAAAGSGSGATSVAAAISRTTSTMSRFALKTWSCRSAPLPRRRISSTPVSSSSEPRSRA